MKAQEIIRAREQGFAVKFDEVYTSGLDARDLAISIKRGGWSKIPDAPLFKPFHNAERDYLTFRTLASLGSANIPEETLREARQQYVTLLADAIETNITVSNAARSLDGVRSADASKVSIRALAEEAVAAADQAIGEAVSKTPAR